MKIAIASRLIPFEESDRTPLCAELENRLVSAGHNIHILSLPVCTATLKDFAQSVLSLRLLSVMNADRLVVLDPLLCTLQHPYKIGCFVRIDGNEKKTETEVCSREFLLGVEAECKQLTQINTTTNGDFNEEDLSKALKAITG